MKRYSLFLTLVLGACGGGGAPAPHARPPLAVAAEPAALADYTPRLTVLGTVTPLQSVAVRPRVDGQIEAILFHEGDTVRAGQPLFRLDDRAVRAQMAQNHAAMASAVAVQAQAAADLRRSQALVANGFVSKATIEVKQAAADTARANIDAARATIVAAETQLSYLTVRAPVGGRTGEINYKVGATVRTADALPLVTVNQLQPILVRFAVPPETIQPLRQVMAAHPVAVTARIHGNAAGIATGRLVFLDNSVDAATGNLAAKAEFANAGDALWPGALVDLDLPLGAAAPHIAVPEAAVQTGPDFPYVWTVDAAGKVVLTRVAVAGRAGGRAFIAQGVRPGMLVVTDALAKLRPGDPVRVKGRA
ncbi:MAG: efflux RND transporter periplasmic adaptor subunit [Sphingomonadaceae bacterium]|nr:efflux RND transporter periplasmic adaptor subunit [Sphingomonadaceae bacterium]